MLRLIIAFFFGGFVALSGVSIWRSIASYTEAEPLHPVAKELAYSLVERFDRENRREMQWSDLTTLLKEERFARLRGTGFIPSTQPEMLMTIRINDRYQFPVLSDGTVTWEKRSGAPDFARKEPK